MNTEGKTTLVRVMFLDSLRSSLPYYQSVQAGFPSPADDYIEEELDLQEHVVKNSEATFFLRVRGQSMIEAGIFEDAIMVVDRSLTPKNGDTVVAALDGDFTVKWYHKPEGTKEVHLLPGNPKFKPIIVREGSHWMFLLWGVVTYIVHKPLRP